MIKRLWTESEPFDFDGRHGPQPEHPLPGRRRSLGRRRDRHRSTALTTRADRPRTPANSAALSWDPARRTQGFRYVVHGELHHRLSFRRVADREQKPLIGGRLSIGERTARPASNLPREPAQRRNDAATGRI